jgi:hypothetical protein
VYLTEFPGQAKTKDFDISSLRNNHKRLTQKKLNDRESTLSSQGKLLQTGKHTLQPGTDITNSTIIVPTPNSLVSNPGG